MRDENTAIYDCDAVTVDASENDVARFTVDARSLPDGELMFEIEVDGEVYHVAGPVTKRANNIAFDSSASKKIVNVVLSQ